MSTGSSASIASLPRHLVDYRAGRALAESGQPLPEGASPATRTGYHIRHEPAAHLSELTQALRALPDNERHILGVACLSTIAKRLPIPAERHEQLAHAALVSALLTLSR